jgi:predicted Zn-dependent protease
MHAPLTTGFSRRSLLKLTAALPIAGAASLLEAREPDIKILPFNKFTDQDEITFGDEWAANHDSHLNLINVGILTDYVTNLVGKLARVSKRPNLPYKAKVVNSAIINAYSFAGGHIWVNRGLLENITNEADLAAVVGHEVGHVVGHHSANEVAAILQAQGLWDKLKKNGVLQNDVVRDLIQKLAPLLQIARMKYSRDNEFDADMFGFYEVLRANYDPNGFVRVMELLGRISGDPGSIWQRLNASHPPPAERLARIRQEAAGVQMPAHPTTDSLSFKAMKLGLKALPPAPKSDQ